MVLRGGGVQGVVVEVVLGGGGDFVLGGVGEWCVVGCCGRARGCLVA